MRAKEFPHCNAEVAEASDALVRKARDGDGKEGWAKTAASRPKASGK